MILKGALLALFSSFVSFLVHFCLALLRKQRKDSEPPIFELKRQTKLLSFIWSMAFIVYCLLFFLPINLVNNLVSKLYFSPTLASFIYGIIFYFLLCFAYLTFYYFIERSVSATLLEIIEYSPDKRLTFEEIKKIYDIEMKYQSELTGMLEGGFIIKETDYYRNTFKGHVFAKVARFARQYLKLGQGS